MLVSRFNFLPLLLLISTTKIDISFGVPISETEVEPASFDCSMIRDEVYALEIKGEVLNIHDLPSFIQECEKPGRFSGPMKLGLIRLFASREININSDFNAEGKELEMFIGAPKWVVHGNRKIILDGAPGEPHPEKAEEEATGKTGNPGGPGGHFHGVGLDFVNGENLEISVNGGNGGRGQAGGDGKEGTPGQKHVPATDPRIENRPHRGCGRITTTYYFPGTDGGPGGNGGNSGQGGEMGDLELLELRNTSGIRQIGDLGADGPPGSGGKGGKGGENGCRAIWENKCFLAIHLTPEIISETCETGRANNGPDGSDGKNLVNRQTLRRAEIFERLYAQLMQYMIFIGERRQKEKDAKKKEELKSFYDIIDNDSYVELISRSEYQEDVINLN